MLGPVAVRGHFSSDLFVPEAEEIPESAVHINDHSPHVGYPEAGSDAFGHRASDHGLRKKMPGCPTLTDLETRETEKRHKKRGAKPENGERRQILREKERTIEGGHRERHRGRKRRQKNIKRLLCRLSD